MKLTIIKENDDGSADVQLENIDSQMMTLLLQTGFIKLLTDALDLAEKEKRMPALFKKADNE
jgi:hypothetical protein